MKSIDYAKPEFKYRIIQDGEKKSHRNNIQNNRSNSLTLKQRRSSKEGIKSFENKSHLSFEENNKLKEKMSLEESIIMKNSQKVIQIKFEDNNNQNLDNKNLSQNSNIEFNGNMNKNCNYEKELDDFSKFNIPEIRFDSKTDEINSIELNKNPYLLDDIYELKIIDENRMLYGNKEYKIKDYLDKIKEDTNFLDDYKYSKCNKCTYNGNNNIDKSILSEYYCEECHKNICAKCSEKCKLEKHSLINLDKIKNSLDSIISSSKLILRNYIISITQDITDKKYNDKLDENSIIDISKEKSIEKQKDILLIYEIISNKYNNYFHYKNIESIYEYLMKKYANNINHKIEGNGKVIYKDGDYYIGEFKNNLRNGKGKLYDKNGKIKISFDKLLTKNSEEISENIIKEINFEKYIKQYKVNFSLYNILINCEEEDVRGLIYYFINNELNCFINENKIKEYIFKKIGYILPQDIICILPDNNVIKENYFKKNIYNLKGYLKVKESKNYKISIIYTFTDMKYNMEIINYEMTISEIKSEKEFINIINKIKEKNKNNNLKNGDFIFINFTQSDSKTIKFICNFIIDNFKDDKYNYIIIVHINRNFKKENIGKIPSINIWKDINQIFIDNLNYNNKIQIKDLMRQNIISLLEINREYLQLDEIIKNTLNNFLKKEFIENGLNINKYKEYIEVIVNYISGEKSIKDKIIKIIFKFIENKNEMNYKYIIEEIYKNNMIDKYTVDIASFLLEYIIENIFKKYLIIIFKSLEDNNILTTLYENINKSYIFLSEDQVKEILNVYLDEINHDKNNIYKSKFLFNYNVPCTYNFFGYISNYINNNISINYSVNEKKIRKSPNLGIEQIKEYHDIEEKLLKNVYNEIYNNYKFIFNIIDYIPDELIVDDYITYYIQKYINRDNINNYNDIYHKIIEILIKLRFNKENTIIKSNEEITILFLKIIWLESNINYILDLLKIINNAKIIFCNNDNILYIKIKELIFTKCNFRYIIEEKRNPYYTKEVNECYYLLLASICYCITSDEIKIIKDTKDIIYYNEEQIEINYYFYLLKNINESLQKLDNDLNLFLIEKYIVDDLIKVNELLGKNNSSDILVKFKQYLIDNTNIIYKYLNNNDTFNFSDELNKSFERIYNIITDDKILAKNYYYYNNLRYILSNEISKITDINYRYHILGKLLQKNEIIKISNNIFQIVLANYFKMDNFYESTNKILQDDNIIIKIIESNLNNHFLQETLLYFFEINSLKYYNYKKKISENKIDEPIQILNDCIQFLDNFNTPEKMTQKGKSKELYKLFCISYIKTFCYTFIKTFNDNKFKPKIIIDICNGNNSICKIIRLFIFKVIYNNFTKDLYCNKDYISEYKLNEYRDYKDLIQNKNLDNIYKIDSEVKTLKNEYFKKFYQAIKKYEKENYKNMIDINDYKIIKIGIDNFYIATFNSTLSNLQLKDYNINENFYKNICKLLFREKELLLKALELFYEPKKYNEIKNNYNISQNNIKSLLFGYRYCLNELYSKNIEGIYYPLYDKNNINYLCEKYYPGNDIKNIPYYELLSKIKKHFEEKPNQGCYICLCNNGFYQCVPSDFPGNCELDKKCPNCLENIGTYLKENKLKIINRKNYFRIFKNKEEIEEIKNEKTNKYRLKEINYITLEEFKKIYINKLYEEEKGICLTDENHFKNNSKIIRNLSQISYRILNYILYSHLFFSRLITNNKKLDKYLPEKMNWTDTLNECWIILKMELLKLDIYSAEEFMNYIFTDLFIILNNQRNINNYDELIIIEDKLENEIQKLIKEYKEKSKKYENNKDVNSFINLVKDKFMNECYKFEENQFYKYFYYTDYLDEQYLSNQLNHMDKRKYPVLNAYLKYINNNINCDKENKNEYLFDNFNLFNDTLNLINKQYFNKITREEAKKKRINETEIYLEKKKLFDNFIQFYNKLEIINKENLSNNNCISDFFIEENNNVGRTYKIIYETFINQQNEKIEKLLNLKIGEGIFDISCKNRMNVQSINKNNIFNLKLPVSLTFIDILYNCSYRKIIENTNLNNKLFCIYEINYDLIEEYMTNLLLKDKKLLDKTINEFRYSNEIFSNQITNVFTLFRSNFLNNKINLEDKFILYKYYKENENNIYLHKKIINDYILFIKFLNNVSLNKNNIISENKKIYEIDEIKDITSNAFKALLDKKEGFTVDKILEMLEYYLRLIYGKISKEIIYYQEKLEDDKSVEYINNYFLKKNFIKKKDFSYSIRIFISLVLFFEDDKENKIKKNCNNIINYLFSPDLWKTEIYDKESFTKDLIEIKKFNVKINQIIPLYEILGGDVENNYFDDVIELDKRPF